MAENRLPGKAPRFHFTDVPAELRERVISELKARPEFKEAWEGQAQGAGVTLSLKMPDPVEFSWDGRHFLAFAWMGEIHVWGLKEPLSHALEEQR